MHMLERLADGSYSMAYAGETPWHGLGTKVPPNLTPKEMLKAAKLDWKTKLIPTFYNYDGKKHSTGDAALVRENDGRFYTTVPNNWKFVQNSDAAEFFSDYVKEASATMETAGSIDDGRKVWFLAKLKEDDFSLFKGKDRVEPYLLLTSPNMYGMSTSVSLTAIRVVCNNTLTMSLGASSGTDKIVRVSHRKEFIAEDVKATLGLVHTKMKTYKEAMTFLSTKNASPEKVSEYLQQVFPYTAAKQPVEAKASPVKLVPEMSRAAQIARDVIQQQPGAEFGEGTWYQPFQAVTFTADHLIGRNDSSRLNSAWYGEARKRKIRGLELALEFAQAA